MTGKPAYLDCKNIYYDADKKDYFCKEGGGCGEGVCCLICEEDCCWIPCAIIRGTEEVSEE